MTIAVHTLAQLPFFAGLDNDTLLEIAPDINERTFSTGQVILSEGDPCQAVYLVAQGVVRTRRMSLEGREHVIAYLGPGESVNFVPVLDGSPALNTVDALTNVTLYAIPCDYFRQIVHDHQEVALAVLEYLAAEVRHLTDMVEDLALHPVRTRLARFLLTQVSTEPSLLSGPAETAEATTGSESPRRRWTQEEIAAHIGTVREMVGRTLRAFANEGLVRRERGRIVVVDRERLEREAIGG
ncbi:MAG: Crp/Fnr family transcriptional regulator [Chloroflexota bacterium]|nr:Crp/Fnr family transcriptional regulator [Chloroflexota bacterium]